MINPASPFQSKNFSCVYTCPQIPVPVNPKKGSRHDKWDPTPYDEDAGPQAALSCISLYDPVRKGLIETERNLGEETSWKTKKVLQVTPQLAAQMSNAEGLPHYYEDLIQHHISTRVALFFQQAIACYNTPFHFRIASTEGQVFSAPTLKVKAEGQAVTNVSFQAAHSSTIPGLKACLREDYEASNEDDEIEPEYFMFLKGSQIENYGNSTVGLPTFVNQIDTLIDGKEKENKLRTHTIDLINQVALARINPVQATRSFLEHVSDQLRIAGGKPDLATTKVKVIRIYQQRIQEMKSLAKVPERIGAVHPFFDSLLSVNLTGENAQDVPVIRDIVFKRKYEVIRESQFLESKIQLRIGPDLTNKDKQFLRLALIFHCGVGSELGKVLEKLFCISLEVLQNDANLVAEIEEDLDNNKTFYDNLLRDIRADVRHFQKMEQAFQAMLLRDFRVKLRDLKQKELSTTIETVINKKIAKETRKRHPNRSKIKELRMMPTSPATVSRLENSRIHIDAVKHFATPENQRRKALSLRYAKIVAKALNIQTGHFFCSFFASKQVS